MARRYELCCLLRSEVTSRSVEEIQKKVTSLVKAQGGTVKGFDQWASTPLAFPVKKERKGVYAFTQFEADRLTLEPLRTYLTHQESVLRHEIFHMADDYDYAEAKKHWMTYAQEDNHFDSQSPRSSDF